MEDEEVQDGEGVQRRPRHKGLESSLHISESLTSDELPFGGSPVCGLLIPSMRLGSASGWPIASRSGDEWLSFAKKDEDVNQEQAGEGGATSQLVKESACVDAKLETEGGKPEVPLASSAEEEASVPAVSALTPWEQHAGVINMARFDYGGPESLLKGRAGFFITCGYRREKSATKEALAILEEYLRGGTGGTAASLGVVSPRDSRKGLKRKHEAAVADERCEASGARRGAAVRARSAEDGMASQEEITGEGRSRDSRSTNAAFEPPQVLEAEAENACCENDSGTCERERVREERGGAPGGNGGRVDGLEVAAPTVASLGEGDAREPRAGPLGSSAAGVSSGGGKGCQGNKEGDRDMPGGTSSADPGAPGGASVADPDAPGDASMADRDAELALRNSGGLTGEAGGRRGLGMSLVKLSSMGIVFVAISGGAEPKGGGRDEQDECGRRAVTAVGALLSDLKSGRRAALKWCQRILPVQTTCGIANADLKAAVRGSVDAFLSGRADSLHEAGTPLKFAVGFKGRGNPNSTSGASGSRGSGAGSETSRGLEVRQECVAAAAQAVADATAHGGGCQVDLSEPQVAIIVEVLPVSLAHTSQVCAISVLPREMVDVKPRLAVKPLSAATMKFQTPKM